MGNVLFSIWDNHKEFRFCATIHTVYACANFFITKK